MNMLREIITSDFKRHGIQKVTIAKLFRVFVANPNPGLKFMTILRATQHYRRRNRFLFYCFFLWYRRLKFKYGFDISYRTTIGRGFYIGHFGGIVIHGDTIIGDNCNLSQGVTIGILNRGKAIGVPTFGNGVFIGPGAVILGGITIGNNALIGTNAVVNFNVPDHAVVAAPRATVISYNGAEGYVSQK